MEKAKVIENKGCSVCSVAAACLATLGLPDFELAAISGVFTAFG